jgi:serine O-acetyltransferase
MIDSKAALRRYLAADLRGHGVERWRAHYRLTKRIVYFQWLLRRTEYWTNCRLDPLGRLVATVLRLRTKLLGERMGFSIPRNTFGPGLSIAHVGTIVVNMHARIGANCRIHQGVTIGEANGRYPIVGDNAHISPNACIIGASLGDDVHVWTGAVVTRDFESGTDIAGVPARVIRSRYVSPQ